MIWDKLFLEKGENLVAQKHSHTHTTAKNCNFIDSVLPNIIPQTHSILFLFVILHELLDTAFNLKL